MGRGEGGGKGMVGLGREGKMGTEREMGREGSDGRVEGLEWTPPSLCIPAAAPA